MYRHKIYNFMERIYELVTIRWNLYIRCYTKNNLYFPLVGTRTIPTLNKKEVTFHMAICVFTHSFYDGLNL